MSVDAKTNSLYPNIAEEAIEERQNSGEDYVGNMAEFCEEYINALGPTGGRYTGDRADIDGNTRDVGPTGGEYTGHVVDLGQEYTPDSGPAGGKYTDNSLDFPPGYHTLHVPWAVQASAPPLPASPPVAYRTLPRWLAILLAGLLMLVAVRYYFMYRDNMICCGEDIGCFTTTSEGLYDDLPMPKCPEDIGVQFVLHTRMHEPQVFSKDRMPEHFDPTKKTVYLIHGFLSSSSRRWVLQFTDIVVREKDMQAITVDWSESSQQIFYPQAASDVRAVAREVSVVNNRLIELGRARPELLWCVGNSLGAHACGIAGKRTHFGRITGLDPAGVEYEDNLREAGLHRASADLVDVIHTDGIRYTGRYGTMKPMGHVDFYPNWGGYQPGCKEHHNIVLGCSHMKGVYYFLESLTSDSFVAEQKCDSYDDRGLTSCSPCKDNCPIMGFGMNFTLQDDGDENRYLYYVPVPK